VQRVLISESQSCNRDTVGKTAVDVTGIPFRNEATISEAELTVQLSDCTSSTVTSQVD
jgi:hypothetical protein